MPIVYCYLSCHIRGKPWLWVFVNISVFRLNPSSSCVCFLCNLHTVFVFHNSNIARKTVMLTFHDQCGQTRTNNLWRERINLACRNSVTWKPVSMKYYYGRHDMHSKKQLQFVIVYRTWLLFIISSYDQVYNYSFTDIV